MSVGTLGTTAHAMNNFYVVIMMNDDHKNRFSRIIIDDFYFMSYINFSDF